MLDQGHIRVRFQLSGARQHLFGTGGYLVIAKKREYAKILGSKKEIRKIKRERRSVNHGKRPTESD